MHRGPTDGFACPYRELALCNASSDAAIKPGQAFEHFRLIVYHVGRCQPWARFKTNHVDSPLCQLIG